MTRNHYKQLRQAWKGNADFHRYLRAKLATPHTVAVIAFHRRFNVLTTLQHPGDSIELRRSWTERLRQARVAMQTLEA